MQCASTQLQSQGKCDSEEERISQDYYGQVLISQATGKYQVHSLILSLKAHPHYAPNLLLLLFLFFFIYNKT